MHITLYRKYRPTNFDEIVGENEIVKTLKTSLKTQKLAHAYLFSGPRGVGKTSIARLIAKGINCITNGITDTPCGICENCKEIALGNFLDLIEIDAASNRGIDEIRQLKEKINYKPTKGRKKIYIIDEVHMLTKEAFNALLKTLEEPPEHILFILATTEPDKILPTIISRCQRYDFNTINLVDMTKKIEYIVTNEKYEIDTESIKAIYDFSGGSMRDAISTLERLMINSENNIIKIDTTEKILGIPPIKIIDSFLNRIVDYKQFENIEILEDIYSKAIDIELFFKACANHTKNRVLKNSLDMELGLKIIDTIYDVLHKFKYEEDKKLLGYVILNRFNKEKKEIIIERVIEKNNQNMEEKMCVDTPNSTLNQSNITYNEVKNLWNNIVVEAKKTKIIFGAFLVKAYFKNFINNTLIIGLEKNQEFAKTMMEMEPYRSTFIEVVRKILKSEIKLEYEVEKKEVDLNKKNKDSYAKQIIDFFGGEVL